LVALTEHIEGAEINPLKSKINWLMAFREIKPLFNPLKPRERERVRKDSIRVEEKSKHLGESERRFISEGEKRASC
jgi:hypothetical protein